MRKKHLLLPVIMLAQALFAPMAAEEASTGYKTYTAKDFSHLKGLKGISDQLMAMHLKLYEGYVKNSNLLHEQLDALSKDGKDRSPQYAGLKRIFGWEFDGMRLHEYYFGNLGGDGQPVQDGSLYKSLVKQFGSFENWKKDFISTGMIRGIGWAVLYQDPSNGNLVNTWINEHDLGHLAGGKPLIIMDVFEHAYITEYGLNREDYIKAFFNNLSWKIAEERFNPKPAPVSSSNQVTANKLRYQ